jgi:hypothetical protein
LIDAQRNPSFSRREQASTCCLSIAELKRLFTVSGFDRFISSYDAIYLPISASNINSIGDSGATRIFELMGKLRLCRKKRWAKWASFLLMGLTKY